MRKKKSVLEEIRDLAADLVEQGGFEQPPICPYSLAARNGILVREEYLVNSRSGYAQRVDSLNAWLVTLPSSEPPAERHFQLAQKIIELLLPSKEGRRIPEEVYQEGASELLMPSAMFNEISVRYNYDLGVLKQKFGHVTYEAIGRRVLSQITAILTIVDNAQLTLRLGSAGLIFPKWPTPQEMEAIWTAYDKGRPIVSDGVELCVKAWPVNQPDTARVVALSFPKRA